MGGIRRKFPRIIANFPIKYEVIKWNKLPHHPHKAMVTTCHDISARGIRFEHNLDLTDRTIGKLREGSLKLNLEFTLPNVDKPINLLGRMIYCQEDENQEEDVNKQCMGVLFIDIDAENYSRINEFIQLKISGKL